MKSIFSLSGHNDFLDLLDLCEEYIEIDRSEALISIKEFSHKLDNSSKKNKIKILEDRWYNSCRKGFPDYSVYNDPYYICDIWICWALYSRKSLLSISNKKSLITKSVSDYIGDIGSVLDMGCGFGYTTAGLKEIFKNANVFGTNIDTSYQYKVAQKISRERNFNVVSTYKNIKNVDLIFASEYFEHIINPIEHLYDIIMSCRPKYFVIANGFNGIAIGHFTDYQHQNKKYSPSEMSKNFNKSMKILGYRKIKTKIWNNRPSFWERM